MSCTVILSQILKRNPQLYINACVGSIRLGHHLRGKPPGEARTLQQRLAELNYEDPETTFKVDIGFPVNPQSKLSNRKDRLKVYKAQKSDSELERLARTKELTIDLDKARKKWLSTTGPNHIKTIAEHYGVFQHLFGDAYFLPQLPLDLYYTKDEVLVPVYYGNLVKPNEAVKMPAVKWESDEDSLWTLVMTNPDGHLTDSNSEYVHWFVGNIPGNDISQGETVVNYLQPIPSKGTGYHRHVFVLYKQESRLDFAELKKDGLCLSLSDRTFSTLDFYRERQDLITPAALSFFQSDWDKSLTDFYHNVLDMKEPIYEYDFSPPYVRPQEWYPIRRPFNLYMDRYRDPKQINKEFLVRKLQNVHPFRYPKPPLPYPNAEYFEGYTPSWLKLEKQKSRLRHGRINDI